MRNLRRLVRLKHELGEISTEEFETFMAYFLRCGYDG